MCHILAPNNSAQDRPLGDASRPDMDSARAYGVSSWDHGPFYILSHCRDHCRNLLIEEQSDALRRVSPHRASLTCHLSVWKLHQCTGPIKYQGLPLLARYHRSAMRGGGRGLVFWLGHCLGSCWLVCDTGAFASCQVCNAIYDEDSKLAF